MRVLKTILQYKYIYIILFSIIIFLSIIRSNLSSIISQYSITDQNFLLKVISVKNKSNQSIIEFSGKEKLISYYDDFPYDVGDVLNVEGNLVMIKKNTIPNLFDYQSYMKNKGIFYELKISKITFVSKNNSLFNKIKNWVNKRINEKENSKYLYTFILGDTSYFNAELRDNYQDNGIFFLFSIGSIQILALAKILEKLKQKLRMKEKSYLVLFSIIVLFYLNLVNMKIGILRSSLCYIIRRLKKRYGFNIKDSDLILLVGSIILLFKPNYLYNMGFFYSFIISYGISRLRKYVKGSYLKKMLIISFLANILSFPINIYFNYKVNVLSVLFSVVVSPIVHFIIFPLSILYFIFPFMGGLFNGFISLFENLNNLFGHFSLFVLTFRKPSILIIILYYLIISLSFQKKKMVIIFIIILAIHLNINKIIKEKFATFLDVGQGDCIVLKLLNDVSLIDTGGIKNISNVIKYLNSLGIDKINRLIITHGDYDHMGEAINLVNNFRVEKVIFNCGIFNELENELIKVLDNKKISYYSCIKELNTDNNKLYFLQTKEYDNENDNSNVIYTEISGYKFMFMGDASVTTEKEIMNKYNISNIDVLKVGHHGSKTSSSIEFINRIKPEYSIISVGKNNRYGHPNKEVLNNLEQSKIYRTDQDGSIMFKIKNNKLQIETFAP